ncbi:MAG TPA: hypothetical protein VJH23_00540 [archaeon]|nr:hypothetical protein [archaeon]
MFVENSGLLSIEAAASLAVLIVIALSLPSPQPSGAENLFTMQKMDDMLIVWARNGTGMNEMVQDAELALGKGNFEIEIYGEDHLPAEQKMQNGKLTVREIRVFSPTGPRAIRLSVAQ